MKRIFLVVLFAGAVYYQFFAGQTVGVYEEDGAPKTVLFTTGQCGKACDETRKYLLRRKVEFEEHDAFDHGAGSDLYTEFGPARIRSRELTALQRNFDSHDEPRIVMYATAWCGYCKKARQYFADNGIDFVEYDIERDRSARRDYDALLGSGTPLLYQGYTRVAGFDQRRIEDQFDL